MNTPLKPQPIRLAELPECAPMKGDFSTQDLPQQELSIGEWEKNKRPPIFHAYTPEITQDAGRRFFINISAVDEGWPFLWLSTDQYKTCKQGHSCFKKLDLVLLTEGLAARWHLHTYVVSYDFTHVTVTVKNTTAVSDQLTGVPAGQTVVKRFNLTTSGAIPVIASPMKRKAMFMEFL